MPWMRDILGSGAANHNAEDAPSRKLLLTYSSALKFVCSIHVVNRTIVIPVANHTSVIALQEMRYC
jgi:hypothetical protein